MTSASDNGEYPAFCLQAVENDTIFRQFRQNPVYGQILEHFSFNDGQAYLEDIEKEHPQLLEKIDVFRDIDNFGGPPQYQYGRFGLLSPSLLHYLKQLGYLEKYFGNLDGKKIIEIGGGFGGLAKLVIDRFDVQSYTIVDLPEALKLSEKFLGQYGDKYLSKINFGVRENTTNQYDLCISNCAFTECTPNIQDRYIEEVIRHCERGFMLYNFRIESYHPVILLSKLERAGLKRLGSANTKEKLKNSFILAWNTNIPLDALPYKRRYIYQLSPFLYRLLLKCTRALKGKKAYKI